jgi:hypothetical protein
MNKKNLISKMTVRRSRGRSCPVKATSEPRVKCFFFHRVGRCIWGSFCRFEHDPPRKIYRERVTCFMMPPPVQPPQPFYQPPELAPNRAFDPSRTRTDAWRLSSRRSGSPRSKPSRLRFGQPYSARKRRGGRHHQGWCRGSWTVGSVGYDLCRLAKKEEKDIKALEKEEEVRRGSFPTDASLILHQKLTTREGETLTSRIEPCIGRDHIISYSMNKRDSF